MRKLLYGEYCLIRNFWMLLSHIMKKIILASQSPSRKKILTDLGYTFTVQPSFFEEKFDFDLSPEENVEMLAQGKAQDRFDTLSPSEQENSIVIGVDTIMVDPNGKLLEKPKDRKNAEKMMSTRSGQNEVLLSGICMLSGDKKFSGYEKTKLSWQEISAQQIQKILDTDEWKGKCGGIAIEGYTGLHIAQIIGNYSNVMGFPINEFLKGIKTLQEE